MNNILINLPEREDRLKHASDELNKYNIPFEVVSALKSENGARGLLLTIYNELYRADFDLTIFEDDILFLQDPNLIMELAMKELPHDWDILYLGGTCLKPLIPHSEHLFQVQEMLATHAMCISVKGIKLLIKEIEEYLAFENKIPIDLIIARQIQPLGKCFVVNPLLAIQREGYSDIEKKHVNYSFMETLFNRFKPHG